MMATKVPAYISHTVLVHAGSFNDFVSKLTTKYPQLRIKFTKKVAIHYYVIQLEDHTEIGIKKQQIYELPIMALREEFSGFVFFKNTKGYNNVLKRMCGAPGNEMAAYDLLQHMLTPFEKSVMLNLESAKSLTITDSTDVKNPVTTTLFKHEDIIGIKTLNKLFSLQTVKIDNEEKDLSQMVKEKSNWTIGIH